MELSKGACQRKADARARRCGSLAAAAVEGLEDAVAQLLRHQGSVVREDELYLVVLLCPQVEFYVVLAILHCIIEHVRHDLREAFLVDECVERFVGMHILRVDALLAHQ